MKPISKLNVSYHNNTILWCVLYRTTSPITIYTITSSGRARVRAPLFSTVEMKMAYKCRNDIMYHFAVICQNDVSQFARTSLYSLYFRYFYGCSMHRENQPSKQNTEHTYTQARCLFWLYNERPYPICCASSCCCCCCSCCVFLKRLTLYEGTSFDTILHFHDYSIRNLHKLKAKTC